MYHEPRHVRPRSTRSPGWPWPVMLGAGILAAGPLLLSPSAPAGTPPGHGHHAVGTPPGGHVPAPERTARRMATTDASGWKERLRPSLAALATSLPDVYARGCQADFPVTAVTVCTDGDDAARTTVLTIGDSHGANWQPAMASLGTREHWRSLSATKSACPVWDVPTTAASVRGRYVACQTWRHNAFALAVRLRPTVVILHSAVPWNRMLDAQGRPVDGEGNRAAAFTRAVEASVAAVRPSGAVVVAMQDAPGVPYPVEPCLEAAAEPTTCTFPSLIGSTNRRVFEQVAAAAGAVVVDTYPAVCPAARCPVVVGDIVVYRGGGHLTVPYVLRERPWVRSWLEPLLRR
jgi:hypothetical protein